MGFYIPFICHVCLLQFCDKHYKEMEKMKKKFTNELDNLKSELDAMKTALKRAKFSRQ